MTEPIKPPAPRIPSDADPAMTAVFEVPRTDLDFLSADSHPMQVEVVGGPMDGMRRRVTRSVFTIGRGESNELSLGLDVTVSTHHARIIKEEDHYWLEDLDSRNGTYVGDQRISTRTPIGSGTLFIIGRTCVELVAV
jgi:pSer/pThr/pTyr-binding forkhead associated (FHA) protein